MNYPTEKQVNMLCWLSRKYVEKLPDRMVKDGKANMKYADYGEYVKKQDQGIVSSLIGTLHDNDIPESVKQEHFNLFLTKGI